VLLAEVAETSRALAATRSRTAKTALLADLLSRAQPAEVGPVVGYLIGDPRQGRIGVGWSALAKVLPASEGEHDGQGATAESAEPAASDAYDEVAARVLQSSSEGSQGLEVLDFDAALDRLAATRGVGSAAQRDALLRELLAPASRAEQQLMTAVFMGEVRHGALDGVLVTGIAAAAGVAVDVVQRAYMLSGDLRVTASLALTGGADALTSVGLEVLRPVRPMLAATAAGVTEALALTGAASVEFKLDGARIQVHRDGPDVRVYTRSLADMTHRVPEVVAVARALPVNQVVLDGESLALDSDSRPRAFQDTMSRFGADAPREQLLRPYFFDVLHVDGVDLLDRPLAERLDVLERVAADWRVPGVLTADGSAGEQVLADALAAGHEGVVVKALDAPYAAGRRGGSWRKVKPVRTLDLVVLAAEWGHGRRVGWLSNLHLGARDPDGTYGEPGGFVMVGKTFKGLTDALLTWQTAALQEVEQRRTRGTVWVRPTLVVEIALDGAQQSPRYPGGVALRFARVLRYRDDKSAEETDTIQDVRALLPGR